MHVIAAILISICCFSTAIGGVSSKSIKVNAYVPEYCNVTPQGLNCVTQQEHIPLAITSSIKKTTTTYQPIELLHNKEEFKGDYDLGGYWTLGNESKLGTGSVRKDATGFGSQQHNSTDRHVVSNDPIHINSPDIVLNIPNTGSDNNAKDKPRNSHNTLDRLIVVTYPRSEDECQNIQNASQKSNLINSLDKKEISKDQKTKLICIVNGTRAAWNVSAQLKKWARGNNETYKPISSKDFTISPGTFKVEPRSTQLVRLVKAKDVEANADIGYALLMESRPTSKQQTFSKIIPLILKARQERSGVALCKAEIYPEADSINLVCHNSSNVYEVISKIVATNQSGDTNTIELGHYLLPESTTVYNIPIRHQNYNTIDLYTINNGKVYKSKLK
ncbi:fimbria/pilus periplasmic chaperone [Rickettsiales endosymbiont of Peranema trichophorum]|uniref:fimbria/pilus periplasmic chaperone n=1 Tax=Rickettsiales endosymbiont of Peranema trichophorum TaxID=2486577 RepID=UPI0013EE57A4|nr:fimbria/pilus periplasmic chaperone [Rickettsiales endosymbiont of Peranema trichophorum]